MAEASDSPEVQTFMAAFQKLRNLVDDAPEVIVSEARDNGALRRLCHALFDAALQLKIKERSRRELYSAPTNPAFVKAWRDYERTYSASIYEVVGPGLPKWDDLFAGDKPESAKSLVVDPVALAELLGDTPQGSESGENGHERAVSVTAKAISGGFMYRNNGALIAIFDGVTLSYLPTGLEIALPTVPGVDVATMATEAIAMIASLEDARVKKSTDSVKAAEFRKNFMTRWEQIDDAAYSTAQDIEFVINWMEGYLEELPLNDHALMKLKFDAKNGIAAWRSLINEVGFDLAGALRRRELAPFVMIPRHVSARHGAAESLSLPMLLRQAYEAFIYGSPFAAIAIMRAILEVLLKEQYSSTGADLNELISTAKRLPADIPRARLHRLRKLGNLFLHPRDNQNPNDVRLSETKLTKEKLNNEKNFEQEILSHLVDLQTLIEQAPDQSRRK
jgi:Domain of unknown function (DUF4145)